MFACSCTDTVVVIFLIYILAWYINDKNDNNRPRFSCSVYFCLLVSKSVCFFALTFMFTFIGIHIVYFRFCMFAVCTCLYHLHMQPLRHVSDLRVLCLYH